MRKKSNHTGWVLLTRVRAQTRTGRTRADQTKENVSCLDRRLQLWSEGSIADLLSEGKLIQSRLRRFSPNSGSHNDDHRATVFANLVMHGKISDAIRYLDSSSKGGIFHPNDSCGQDGLSVLDCLRSKHPSNLFALLLVLRSPSLLKALSFILLFLIKLPVL